MKKFICMFMVMCAVPAFAQFTPSTLRLFKDNMLEKKDYAGIILKQSVNQISPDNFMADIDGFSSKWTIEIVGDTIISCYRYAVGNDLVRFYMKILITTGQVISLQRNSSGTIYWWTKIWTPIYTARENYKTKKTKLPKRPMDKEENKITKMFETVVQVVTSTFSTTNAQADSIIYRCFAKKDFANDEEFGGWKSIYLNDVFCYQFIKDAVKDDKKGYYVITISPLDKKVEEVFIYCTVEPMIEKRSPDGFSLETNPEFDPQKHIVSIPMTGYLLPDLWEEFH